MRLTVNEDELMVIDLLIKKTTWQGDSVIPVANLLAKVQRGLAKLGSGSVIVETDDNRKVIASNG
jgi:hypothetical protein